MKTAHNPASRSQGGFSLVELMVGVAIGLLVMAGILGLFVTNKGVFTNTTQATELQENGRFALGYLLRDLRNAYFFGETHFNNLDLDEEGPSNSDVKTTAKVHTRSTASRPTRRQHPFRSLAQQQTPEKRSAVLTTS
jgi:prepilin-type N-terminal cleavage/methylation domain-containing protein